MHVAALLLCWIRVTQGSNNNNSSISNNNIGGGGILLSHQIPPSGMMNNSKQQSTMTSSSLHQRQASSTLLLHQRQPSSTSHLNNSYNSSGSPLLTTPPPQQQQYEHSSSFGDTGALRTLSPSGGGISGGYKHASVQIGDVNSPELSLGHTTPLITTMAMSRPPYPPPQLIVVMPWVQAIGSMTSVMSNSWTFYYRLSEVVYTALLFIGDVWVGIQCATTSTPPQQQQSSSNTTTTSGVVSTAAGVENSNKSPVGVSAQSSFQDLNDPVALRKALNRL